MCLIHNDLKEVEHYSFLSSNIVATSELFFEEMTVYYYALFVFSNKTSIQYFLCDWTCLINEGRKVTSEWIIDSRTFHFCLFDLCWNMSTVNISKTCSSDVHEMAVFVWTKSNKRSVISVEGLNNACQCIEQNNKLCFHLRLELPQLFILPDSVCQ